MLEISSHQNNVKDKYIKIEHYLHGLDVCSGLNDILYCNSWGICSPNFSKPQITLLLSYVRKSSCLNFFVSP